MKSNDSLSRQRLEHLYSPPEIGAPGKRQAQAQRRDLLLAGLFVLSMAAVAGGALTLLLPGILGRAYRTDAYFLDANGLDVGIQVIQDGYVIGLVERVTPIFPGRDALATHCPAPPAPRQASLPCFRATLRIKDGWPVPRDSVARLDAAGLFQGDVVRIAPGHAPELLGEGAILDGQAREPELMAQIGKLTDTVNALVMETIAPTLVSLREQVKTIETLLGTGTDQSGNRARLAAAFENLQSLSARLKDAIDPAAVAAILSSVRNASGNLERLSADLSGSGREMQRTVANYDALAADLRKLVRDRQPALARTLDETQLLLQELMAALTPILTNLEDATRDLSALARELRDDPATLIKNRDVEERTPWFQ